MSMSTITQYRKDHELTLEAFADKVGKSKGHMSEVENTMRCTAKLALDIERVTNGEVDAADLSEDVAEARRSAA